MHSPIHAITGQTVQLYCNFSLPQGLTLRVVVILVVVRVVVVVVVRVVMVVVVGGGGGCDSGGDIITKWNL